MFGFVLGINSQLVEIDLNHGLSLFTPEFGRRILEARELLELCQQVIHCMLIETSWFGCNTRISFLQIAPVDNDKGYNQRRDKTCWTLQKGKD